MAVTDYRALCMEIFETDDADQIRKMAASWRQKSTRNAGRKKALTQADIEKMEAMRGSGTKLQEIADCFGLTRQCIHRYLDTRPGESYTMRMDYTLGDKVCTVIFVDFEHEKIVIQNRTDDILCRAFGVKQEPTWQDFEDFLISRCFPKSRGHVKEILNNLGVDGYDPLGIVEATAGRTAEDNMYLTFRTFKRKKVAECRELS